jgi:hypothetical protein
MKGTIVRCLADLVHDRWGAETWKKILKDAGVSESDKTILLPISDVDDRVALQLLQSTAKVLRVSSQDAADAFGEYWCCTYAPKLYKAILQRFQSAREMILGMDRVHVELTASMPNARPPRFEYLWKSDSTLIVTYKSHRNLVEVYMGLARGVGKFFKEPMTVKQTAPHTVQIDFQ